MAEMLIQSESLTSIADKIRVLSGTEDAMTTAQMDSNLGEAYTDVSTEADLIEQISAALEGKAAGIKLPTLTNPGTADDLVRNKELIDADGNVVTDTVFELTVDYTEKIGVGFPMTDPDTTQLKNYEQYTFAIGEADGDYFLRQGAKVSVGFLSELIDLPSEIIKLNAGTITLPNDISSGLGIEHGLGEKPNFFIIAPVGSVEETGGIGYLYGQMVLWRYFEGSSTTIHGMGTIITINSSNEAGSYSRRDSFAPSDQVVNVAASSSYKLKAGVTYRWVAGVLDGIK